MYVRSIAKKSKSKSRKMTRTRNNILKNSYLIRTSNNDFLSKLIQDGQCLTEVVAAMLSRHDQRFSISFSSYLISSSAHRVSSSKTCTGGSTIYPWVAHWCPRKRNETTRRDTNNIINIVTKFIRSNVFRKYRQNLRLNCRRRPYRRTTLDCICNIAARWDRTSIPDYPGPLLA